MKKNPVSEKSLQAGVDYLMLVAPKSAEPLLVPRHAAKVENHRVIGGFHTLCADVGDIPGHPLSGYRAGDILPLSLWNLTHRAACTDNFGMVYDFDRDLWVDIYLASDEQRKIINLSYNDFVAHGAKIGRQLLTHEEFSSAAEGSNELTNIENSARPERTGGHVDTLGRRMISHIGCEDCCGVVYQWLSSTDPADAEYELLAGGFWNFGTICGPRYRYADNCRWYTSSSIGGRFRSEPLHKRGAKNR